jgi:hypothetical protein
MKLKALTLFLFAFPLCIFSQIDTISFGGSFINNYNNRVLIEGCDTFQIAANFSSLLSNTSTAVLITKIGGANEEDYWSNLQDSIWITEDNPIWSLNIYPYQDEIQEGEECILFKIENGETYRNLLRLKIFDEFPEFSLEIESGWDNSETLCALDEVASITITPEDTPPTTEIIDYPINGTSILFVNDTISNVYINVAGFDECNFFEDVFTKVCFSVEYPTTEHLKVSLKSPDDKYVVLYDGEVSSSIMTESCFDMHSDESIEDGGPVYFGTFEPRGDWDDMIGAQLNGVWTLIFETEIADFQGECAYGLISFENENHHKFSYQCDWYPEIRNNSQFHYFDEEEVGLTAGELNLQVHALNCSYDLSTTVYDATVETTDTITCRNSSIYWNGLLLSHPNDYEAIRFYNQNENECDSLLEIFVDYNPVNLSFDFQVLEEDETLLFDGFDISEYGSYTALYENEYGCDSNFYLTVLPPEALIVLANIPDNLVQNSEGCESGVCLPFYSDNYLSFDYFVDDEKLEDFDISICEVSNPMFGFNLSGEFSSDMHHRISELEIDGISYPDFSIRNIEQFLNVLNYYVPDLAVMRLGGSRIYVRREFHLSYTIKSIFSGLESSYSGTIDNADELNTGIFIPMPVGTHEIYIKHKNNNAEKTISATLENHIYPETDTLIFSYLAELNQRINFPLPASDLCGEIISAVEVCSNVSLDNVDFTLSNQGLLSFKPLKAEDFEFCIEICDVNDICQIVILEVDFEEIEREIILQRTIFPNPAQNKVILADEEKFNIEKVIVYDALGRQIKIMNFEPENFVEIDVSTYAEGVYFLEVHINGENYVHKLLIQR